MQVILSAFELKALENLKYRHGSVAFVHTKVSQNRWAD